MDLVCKTMADRPEGASTWDIDRSHQPVLVSVSFGPGDAGGSSPTAYYWVDGETVLAGNSEAQRLSPNVAVSDREIPELKYRKMVEATMTVPPDSRWEWTYVLDEEPASVMVHRYEPNGSVTAAVYMIVGETVFAGEEEAKALSPGVAMYSDTLPVQQGAGKRSGG